MAEIIKDYPPNFEEIKKVLDPPETACYAWGDKIYNPSGNQLNEDLLVHEHTHELQQNGKPEEWWRKYLDDKDFRFKQEVEAYANQLNWLKKRIPARTQKRFLEIFANCLSTIYKLDITYHQAETAIRKCELQS